MYKQPRLMVGSENWCNRDGNTLCRCRQENAIVRERQLMKRNKQRSNHQGSLTKQGAGKETEKKAIAQAGRRGILGLLKKGLGVAAAATGAAVLVQAESGTAHADSVGNFSSSVQGTPAVTAAGTNSALGIQASSDGGTALYATSNIPLSSSAITPTIYGVNNAHSPAIYGEGPVWGVWGANTAQPAGFTGTQAGVFGTSNAGSNGIGVYGDSTDGYGVQGSSYRGTGVYGSSASGTAVYGSSSQGDGVYGASTSGLGGFFYSQSSSGAYAYSAQSTGLIAVGTPNAASFYGNVYVSGSISKGGGSFLIDHPLDPVNKSLFHSFVESPDMKNIYDGVVQLDQNGEAAVTLPAWFSALNSDYRYQLTAIGAAAPGLHIAQEITNNQFKIAGGPAGIKVSWQVTGIRQDAWAKAYRIPVEENKSATQKGLYHHPELFGHPKEKGIAYQATPVTPKAPTFTKPTLPTKPR